MQFRTNPSQTAPPARPAPRDSPRAPGGGDRIHDRTSRPARAPDRLVEGECRVDDGATTAQEGTPPVDGRPAAAAAAVRAVTAPRPDHAVVGNGAGIDGKDATVR